MSGAGLFGVFGGPLAWFLQLCAGYALASRHCASSNVRMPAALDWTQAAMLTVATAAIAVSLLAALVSWRALQRTKTETPGDPRHLTEVRSGRDRFLALWGTVLGSSFAVAAAMTSFGVVILPRCIP
jgi:hypothetical protein